MQSITIHKRPLRGSSSLQGTAKKPDELTLASHVNRGLRSAALLTEASEPTQDDWVRGVRSVRENPKDSLSGNQAEELTAKEQESGNQSDDQRWQDHPSILLWRDDGGESGEEV